METITAASMSSVDELRSLILQRLTHLRDADGTWKGFLSSSALSTATASLHSFYMIKKVRGLCAIGIALVGGKSES